MQDDLIARAVEFARDMDFESAERVLEDAALVRDDRAADRRRQRRQSATSAIEHAGELEMAAVLAMDAGDFEQAERMLIELIALGDMDTTVNQLRRRLEEARVYGGFKPGQTVRDHFLNQDPSGPPNR